MVCAGRCQRRCAPRDIRTAASCGRDGRSSIRVAFCLGYGVDAVASGVIAVPRFIQKETMRPRWRRVGSTPFVAAVPRKVGLIGDDAADYDAGPEPKPRRAAPAPAAPHPLKPPNKAMTRMMSRIVPSDIALVKSSLPASSNARRCWRSSPSCRPFSSAKRTGLHASSCHFDALAHENGLLQIYGANHVAEHRALCLLDRCSIANVYLIIGLRSPPRNIIVGRALRALVGVIQAPKKI
jgi:hypothetical protein